MMHRNAELLEAAGDLMTVRSSHRSPREWLLFIVAAVMVAALMMALWQATGSQSTQQDLISKWTPERFGKLLIGPEQALCYLCCLWAGLILFRRFTEVQRQRQAFQYELLPTEEGARILPEDARPLARKIDQVTARHGGTVLANMIRLGLGKYAVSKSGPDVAEVVRNQAEVEHSRFASSMSTVNYLVWAIPAIGFLGTVRGLAGAMGLARPQEETVSRSIDKYMQLVKSHLDTAFDCTFIALALSLVLMYLLHYVQRAEETLVIDCQDYCQEHLLLRLYDPPATDELGLQSNWAALPGR
jgi:hypothetical protein